MMLKQIDRAAPSESDCVPA